MLTPPDGLPGTVLAAALERSWGLAVTSIEYRPVGWGSRHWEVTDAAGARWFVTADDVENKRVTRWRTTSPCRTATNSRRRSSQAGTPGSAGLTRGPWRGSSGNTMRTADGWLLIDWDTALVAPPERDLWFFAPGNGDMLDVYADATGVTPRPGLIDLYRLRWDIADLAIDVSRFRRPHPGGAEDD